MRVIRTAIRAPGTIQLDERRVSVISMRSESWVQKVANVTTGSQGRQGPAADGDLQPADRRPLRPNTSPPSIRKPPAAPRRLRPRLAAAADESRRSRGGDRRPWRRAARVPITIDWTAPRDGIVLERNAIEGMRAQPGDVLFRVADHVGGLGAGRRRRARSRRAGGRVSPSSSGRAAFPAASSPGKVDVIYPQVNRETRTVARAHRAGQSRCGAAAGHVCRRRDRHRQPASRCWPCRKARCSTPAAGRPCSSTRARAGSSRATVKLGHRGGGYVEIREGVAEGEPVVVSANFLIDAESNLKAALKGFSDAGAQP